MSGPRIIEGRGWNWARFWFYCIMVDSTDYAGAFRAYIEEAGYELAR